jgi:NAD(P)H-dependent FMN reductase
MAETVLLQVITASTRPGRVGPAVAAWFTERAKEFGAFDVEPIDLAEVNLPMFDEPNHPRLGQYVHEHTKLWSRTIARADAFVFVMPEYNHGFNAALKNAIDYLHNEWQHKAVAIVSYGGVAAGTRAAQMLKPVLAALKMLPVTEAVNIPFVHGHISDGVLEPTEPMEAAAKTVLAELARIAPALRALR